MDIHSTVKPANKILGHLKLYNKKNNISFANKTKKPQSINSLHFTIVIYFFLKKKLILQKTTKLQLKQLKHLKMKHLKMKQKKSLQEE